MTHISGIPPAAEAVTSCPVSAFGTKVKKAILREMIAADLKEKDISQAPKIQTAPRWLKLASSA